MVDFWSMNRYRGPAATHYNITFMWKKKNDQVPTPKLRGNGNTYNGNFMSCSVKFNHWVMSDSLWPHEPQHVRPPCPSPTTGAYPNPCPLSRWYHLTISSSVTPFSSCPQSFPASGSFQMSQLFASGGQSIGVSASASVLPMKTRTDLL